MTRLRDELREHLVRDLVERHDVAVHVEAHRRARVAGATGELDSGHALLTSADADGRPSPVFARTRRSVPL